MEVEGFEDDEKCIFCTANVVDELKFGKIYKFEDVITHYFCMLFSAEVQQNGGDSEGILGFLPQDIKKERDRGKKILCTYCKRPGATINCITKNCRKKFHYSCGLENGSLHQFFDNFKSYCGAHRKGQSVPSKCTADVHICLICYDEVKAIPSPGTFWAPCCQTAWFHRLCVQKMAVNGGYFFRCPKCNNNEMFRREILNCGIYIPDKDASWELDPHAYEELGQRHNVCDAETCRCPDGRIFQSPGWQIILCMLCGSQGTHYPCSKAAFNELGKWTCSVCSVTNRPVHVSYEPAEHPGSSVSVSEEIIRLRDDRSKKQTIHSSSSDDSDSESTSSPMRSSVVVRSLEDSDENESDVESDMRSTARIEHPPQILIPNTLPQVQNVNSVVIDLDSDDDVLPSRTTSENISSDSNEVTSTSIDEHIILDDTILDDDNEDDDVVFVSCDDSNKFDDLPQPTALLKFVENNKVFIVSPADVKRIGVENLVSTFYPSASSTETANPQPASSVPMWQPVPLHKSVIRSLATSEINQEDISNCSTLEEALGKRNSNREIKKLRKDEVICID